MTYVRLNSQIHKMRYLPRADTTKESVPSYRKGGSTVKVITLVAEQCSYLQPKAALKTTTQTTTALAVSGTSIYIHHPVRARATPICKYVMITQSTRESTHKSYSRSARQKYNSPTPPVDKVPSKSTRYSYLEALQSRRSTYGGRVLRTQIMAFMPVIRIASRPTHPASNQELDVISLPEYDTKRTFKYSCYVPDFVSISQSFCACHLRAQ